MSHGQRHRADRDAGVAADLRTNAAEAAQPTKPAAQAKLGQEFFFVSSIGENYSAPMFATRSQHRQHTPLAARQGIPQKRALTRSRPQPKVLSNTPAMPLHDAHSGGFFSPGAH